MNKLFILCYSVCIIGTVHLGCNTQDDNTTKPIISEKYEPCCSDSTEVNIELAPGIHVYIPNVFTPNGDGINDYFYPIVDIAKVPNGSLQYFSLFDSNDDSKKRGFFNRDFVNYNELESYSFDGKYYNEETLKWEVWEGQFWYTLTISIEGVGYYRVKGSACSIVCDDEATIFKDKKGCFFPSQVTQKIIGDNALNNNEENCFK